MKMVGGEAWPDWSLAGRDRAGSAAMMVDESERDQQP